MCVEYISVDGALAKTPRRARTQIQGTVIEQCRRDCHSPPIDVRQRDCSFETEEGGCDDVSAVSGDGAEIISDSAQSG